jgi:hypothetical protein
MKWTSSILVAVALCGCPQQPVAVVPGAGASPVPNFTLGCYSASTATSRQVHCIRTDTRTGDVVRANLDKLPVSSGSTGVAASPPGRFQVSCATAASAEQADFYCARLNTETGELMMLNMQKVPQVP